MIAGQLHRAGLTDLCTCHLQEVTEMTEVSSSLRGCHEL